jgi:hypothetical protein
MSAWRGNRQMTWVSGAVAVVVSIGAAFTGYLSQQNFASQWISLSAEDGLNAAGIGAYSNVVNLGQMFTRHVILLPPASSRWSSATWCWCRKHGVAPPFDVTGEEADLR